MTTLPTASTYAATPRFTKVLIPVAVSGEVLGDYGSIWKTVFTGANWSPLAVTIRQVSPGSCRLTCPKEEFLPGEVFSFVLTPTWGNGGPGVLWIESDSIDEVFLLVRVQDVSRQAQTWGTSIPLVYEDDVFTEKLLLMDIPTDERFRVTFRVYDFDGDHETQARIRAYSQTEFPVLLGEAVVTMPWVEGVTRPGYALVTSLASAIPPILSEDKVFVEVTPVTEGLRFWAFVSVTNNETQHVTVISPR